MRTTVHAQSPNRRDVSRISGVLPAPCSPAAAGVRELAAACDFAATRIPRCSDACTASVPKTACCAAPESARGWTPEGLVLTLRPPRVQPTGSDAELPDPSHARSGDRCGCERYVLHAPTCPPGHPTPLSRLNFWGYVAQGNRPAAGPFRARRSCALSLRISLGTR